MPGDQLAVPGHEAGDGPAELGHAGGDPRHLVGVMGLGIAGIGFELDQRPVFNLARQERRSHAASLLAFSVAKVSPVSARTASAPVKACQRSIATST